MSKLLSRDREESRTKVGDIKLTKEMMQMFKDAAKGVLHCHYNAGSEYCSLLIVHQESSWPSWMLLAGLRRLCGDSSLSFQDLLGYLWPFSLDHGCARKRTARLLLNTIVDEALVTELPAPRSDIKAICRRSDGDSE